MAARLRCRAKHGRNVTLTEERWAYIAANDSAVADFPGIDDLIRRALEQPYLATFDRFEQRVYYRKEEFPAPYQGLFLRVSVAYPHRWPKTVPREFKRMIEGMWGEVASVGFVHKPRSKEERWWPTDM